VVQLALAYTLEAGGTCYREASVYYSGCVCDGWIGVGIGLFLRVSSGMEDRIKLDFEGVKRKRYHCIPVWEGRDYDQARLIEG
jgi:hypothetical protein